MADTGTEDKGVNVQVLLRCRPLSEKEIVERTPQAITTNEALREVTLFNSGSGAKQPTSRTFRFDKVFGSDSHQEKLYKQAIVPIVEEVMEGFNCTIFAYGQTGTGKTYTMEGGPRGCDDGRNLSPQAGVIPRSIKQIFDILEANNSDSTVKVSFLELYNEELTDLLSSVEDPSTRLRLLEDKNGVVVQNLEEAIVKSPTEIYQVLDKGTAKRRTAATLLNNRSSRSHSVFTITIHMKETTPAGEDVVKVGKLNLVDLAGSENISRSGAKDQRVREAGSINQSLLTLGRVITSLVEHLGHVPYRDSKLTRLLRDSLGGRTKTCIIATVSPTVQCQEETISTLDYAHRAKNIRNRPELNQKISKTTMIKELAGEIEKLKMDLVATREKNGVFLSLESYEQNELERMQLRETVKSYRSEIEAAEQIVAAETEAMKKAHAEEVDALTKEKEAREAELAQTQQDLNQAHVVIQERTFLGASLKRAEQALAVHAEQLTHELGACTQDITALFARVGEITQLQGSDRQALQGLAAAVGERLGGIGALTQGALSGQSQHFAAVGADLTAFKSQKESDIAVLQQQLAQLQEGVKSLQGVAAQHTQSVAAAGNGALQQVGTQEEAYAQSAAAAAQEGAVAATQAVQALVEGLNAQATDLTTFAQQQATAAEEAGAAVRALASSAHTSLQGVAAAAENLSVSSTQRVNSVNADLEIAVRNAEATAKQQQAQLMEQIGSLVGAFASERAQSMQSLAASVHCQLGSHAQATSADAQGIVASGTAAAAAVQAAEAASMSQLANNSTATQQGIASFATQATSGAEAGTQAVPVIQQHHSTQTSLLEAHTKATAGITSSGSAALEQSAQAANSATASAAGTVSSGQDALLHTLTEQHATNVAMADSLARMTSEAADDASGFSSEHQQAVAALNTQVSTGVASQLAKQANNTAEPPRRPLVVPPMSAIGNLMCPDEELILAQLHAKRQEVLQSGGDVGTTLAQLLSPLPGAAAHMAQNDEDGAEAMQVDGPASGTLSGSGSGSLGVRSEQSSGGDSTARSTGSSKAVLDTQHSNTENVSPREGDAVAVQKEAAVPVPVVSTRSRSKLPSLVDRTNV